MTQYKCSECGTIFDEDTAAWTEELCPTDRGMEHLETDMRCPCCDSMSYDRVYECPICGEWESESWDEPCKSCTDEVLYWTAQAMANIMGRLNIKDATKAVDYIDEATWRLTHNEEDIAYLGKCMQEERVTGELVNTRGW